MDTPDVLRIKLPLVPEPETHPRAIAVFLAGFLMPIVLWMPLSFIAYARGTFDAGTLLGMAVFVTLMACANSVPYLLYARMMEGREFLGVLPRKGLQIAYAIMAIGFSITANLIYIIWPEPIWAGMYFSVPLAGAVMWVGAHAMEGWMRKRASLSADKISH